MSNFCVKTLGGVGALVLNQWHELRYLTAVLATGLFLGLQPRHWRRTVRRAFAHQIRLSGVGSLRFISALAILVGVSVVVQMVVWTGRIGQSRMLGPLLVTVVARELAPLFANFVLIVKGGSALTTGLGFMKISGEVRALEAQGLEPLPFLVMPQLFGMAVSGFCLTVFFILLALCSGYAFGALIGFTRGDLLSFMESVSRSVYPRDVISILAKSLLPAMLTAVICSTGGLGVSGAITEVPRATQRSLGRSLLALLIVSTGISVLTYL